MKWNRGIVFKMGMGVTFSCGCLLFSSCDRPTTSVTPPKTNTVTSPVVQTGNIDDAMKSEASFYAIRGGYDYDRMPLRYPFHLVNITGKSSLCNGKVGVVKNVTAINVQSGFIFGTYGATLSFGETIQGGWFVADVSSRTNISVPTEDEFHQLLAQRGLTNQVLHPVKPLMDEFDRNGVLPFGK